LKAVDKWGFGRWEDVCSDPELPFMKTLEKIAPPPPPPAPPSAQTTEQKSQPQQQPESSGHSVETIEIQDDEQNRQLKTATETKADITPTSSTTTNTAATTTTTTTTTTTENKEALDKDEGIKCRTYLFILLGFTILMSRLFNCGLFLQIQTKSQVKKKRSQEHISPSSCPKNSSSGNAYLLYFALRWRPN
jgi:cell wall-associated NlpC family hydrolase